ncbi:hypothetical protein [Rhodococcus qingshengii]|uniref:hypothetical protein n=1 Tax=Rhodococcus qingshengii TaxID=334542 RepID=UPI00195DC442|nr:hypothetical protein [Rhodococcus qingshengii]QXC45208.1 hypothetical protein KSE96_11910 [Rhodococcus qingshengii]
MDKKTKLLTTMIKSIDEEKKTIRFKVSGNSIDRHGEIVDQSWNLKNFLKNPIMLWNHKSYDVQPEDAAEEESN